MFRTRKNPLEASRGLFSIGIAVVTPLAVLTGAIPLGNAQAPAANAVTTAAFTTGLAAASHLPNSGAFHSYVVAGLGRPAGVATTMVALAAYNAMQIGLYGAFGIAAAPALAVFGVRAYWGAWILAAWLAVGILGQLRMRINAQILIALLCAGAGSAMSAAIRPDRIVTVASGHLTDAAAVLFATGVFAAMLAFHLMVARCTLILAREGVLPRALARTRDDEVAVGGSALQSILAILTLLTIVALGLEPTAGLFFYGTVAGGLGMLIVLCVAGIGAVRFFRRSPPGENLWRRRIAPIVSTMLLFALLLTLVFLGEPLGTVNPFQFWVTPAAYVLIAIGGAARAHHLKRRRPDVYAAIGHGEHAITIRPPGQTITIRPLSPATAIRPGGRATAARPIDRTTPASPDDRAMQACPGDRAIPARPSERTTPLTPGDHATAMRPDDRAIAIRRLPHGRAQGGDHSRRHPAIHLNGR